MIPNEYNQDFIHIRSTNDGNTILSVAKPIGYCKKHGDKAYPSLTKGYYAFCPECNKNFMHIECETITNNIDKQWKMIT